MALSVLNLTVMATIALLLSPAIALTSTSLLGVYGQSSAGVIVGEIEDAAAVAQWRFRRDAQGYTGLGYYSWRSQSRQTANPNKGVLAFDVGLGVLSVGSKVESTSKPRT
jgi:hypothetical protein